MASVEVIDLDIGQAERHELDAIGDDAAARRASQSRVGKGPITPQEVLGEGFVPVPQETRGAGREWDDDDEGFEDVRIWADDVSVVSEPANASSPAPTAEKKKKKKRKKSRKGKATPFIPGQPYTRQLQLNDHCDYQSPASRSPSPPPPTRRTQDGAITWRPLYLREAEEKTRRQEADNKQRERELSRERVNQAREREQRRRKEDQQRREEEDRRRDEEREYEEELQRGEEQQRSEWAKKVLQQRQERAPEASPRWTPGRGQGRRAEIRTRDIPRDSRIDPPPFACFNCWQRNHQQGACPQPRSTTSCCDNCGRRGVWIAECPRCGEGLAEWLRAKGLANGQTSSARQGEDQPDRLRSHGREMARSGRVQPYAPSKIIGARPPRSTEPIQDQLNKLQEVTTRVTAPSVGSPAPRTAPAPTAAPASTATAPRTLEDVGRAITQAAPGLELTSPEVRLAFLEALVQAYARQVGSPPGESK